MNQVSRRRYWPYEEVKASRDSNFPARFVFSAPWLTFYVDVDSDDASRAEQIIRKWSEGSVGTNDIAEINWLFASVAEYPVAYILPRAEIFGADNHQVLNPRLRLESPAKLLEELLPISEHPNVANVAAKLSTKWTWDVDAALEFSNAHNGVDPESIFSVARRYHLLNDLESNKTLHLFSYVSSLEKPSFKFRNAAALILRQNHYVTEKCDSVLRPALKLAQTGQDELNEFMRAESGHDRLLERALKSMGVEPNTLPILKSIIVLMDVFGAAARRNFLGFSMIVDIFERSSYTRRDPLAELLAKGGQLAAAKQIERHREINDSGGHENAALSFLNHMRSVDAQYAIEALRLAELVTLVAHLVSPETLVEIQNH